MNDSGHQFPAACRADSQLKRLNLRLSLNGAGKAVSCLLGSPAEVDLHSPSGVMFPNNGFTTHP
jgi:hypothetical protein